MRRSILSITAILLFQPVIAQKVSDKKIVKQLKKDIGYLASDELKGRRTGSEGEKMAAEHIVSFYKKQGIAEYEGKYIYPFEFVSGRSIDNATLLKVGTEKLTIKEDGFPVAFSGNGSAYGEVIPDVMEQGKIWMISMFEDEEQAKDPHFNWEKAAFEKCENAIKQGAKGVLFYDKFDAKYPAVFNKKTEYESLSIPVAYLSYKGYTQYVDKAKNSILVALNITLKDKMLKGNNIIGFVNNGAKHTVILGAHYDHLGLGQDGNSMQANSKGQIHNGADDNASGSAALMQLASWVKDSELKNYNYLFIHFSAEELGLIGSKKVVEQLGFEGSQVAYMINMDMVGRLNDSTHALTVGGVGTSPAWGKVIDANTGDFKIVLDSAGVGPSDHTSFYHKNIPVLFFFTGTHSDYHKPSDDANKINYTGEALIMKYIYGVVTKMDAMPKPEFQKTKTKEAGKVRFKVTLGIMPDYSYNDGGLKVDGVTDGRPAGKAGVKAGDIITKLGDLEIRGIQTYMEALSEFEEGDKTTVTVMRGGEELTMPLEFTPKK
ncbi:MAG: M28 family peptidase [Chitinophagales bacterium]|nr:M28 family peptidase [Chitinophagaceae bacterium]MCB9064038.1 M28 family peptidase [Chitinophagales bacterium]